MSDLGLTHVALPVTDPDASVAFYERYATMKVVHRRRDPATGTSVVWLSDLTRPFVIVLVEAERVEGGLGGFAHLGVACESRAEVDRRCADGAVRGTYGARPLRLRSARGLLGVHRRSRRAQPRAVTRPRGGPHRSAQTT